MSTIHAVFIGETNKRLSATLLDGNGDAVDLAGSTVELIYRIGEETPVVRDVTLGTETGEVYYDWLTADFEAMEVGDAVFCFKRTTSDGKVDYFPCNEDGTTDQDILLTLRVRQPLA